MQFLRELGKFLYQTCVVILSLACYALFLVIWGITYPIYWIVQLIRSFFAKKIKPSTSIVVSGAGSGMGQMIAVLYARKNANLLLLDINKEGLEETERLCREANAASVTINVCDVTKGESLEEIINTYDDAHPIDAVYPCAALNDTPKSPLPNPVTDFSKIFSVNVIGVYNVINPIMKRMQTRKAGRICLFSSILGFSGSVITPNYTITKNCMRAIAESLRYPLQRFNISISYVCPGGVKTGMTKVLPKWLTWIFITAETAAKMIVDGCEHGDFLIIFPFSGYSLCYALLSGPAYLRQSVEVIIAGLYLALFDKK